MRVDEITHKYLESEMRIWTREKPQRMTVFRRKDIYLSSAGIGLSIHQMKP